MSRRTVYGGAAGPLAPEKARALGRGWRVQPKVDGQLATVVLDAAGCVDQVLSRRGRPIDSARDLLGIFLGEPHAQVVGELEAHTEAGTRAAAERGYARLYLFDAIRIRRSLLDEPYGVRQAALYRMVAETELLEGSGKHWTRSSDGRRRDARGRYSDGVPVSWRRFPILPDYPVSAFDTLWDELVWAHAVEGVACDGLVMVNQRAGFGRRNAKRKIKPTDELDARVVATSPRRCVLEWAGRHFSCGTAGRRELRVGEVVAVRCESLYETGIPKHPRIVRVRDDLR